MQISSACSAAKDQYSPTSAVESVLGEYPFKVQLAAASLPSGVLFQLAHVCVFWAPLLHRGDGHLSAEEFDAEYWVLLNQDPPYPVPWIPLWDSRGIRVQDAGATGRTETA